MKHLSKQMMKANAMAYGLRTGMIEGQSLSQYKGRLYIITLDYCEKVTVEKLAQYWDECGNLLQRDIMDAMSYDLVAHEAPKRVLKHAIAKDCD